MDLFNFPPDCVPRLVKSAGCMRHVQSYYRVVVLNKVRTEIIIIYINLPG